MNSHGHFFSKWVNSSGHFLRVNSHGYGANTVGEQGVWGKPLLGLANTVQFQVSGRGGEASARFSEHCSVSGLG